MNEFKGFIIYATYTVEELKPFIILFGRLEDNTVFKLKKSFKPYFFIKKKDKTTAKKLIKELEKSVEFQETDLKNLFDDALVKVNVQIPKDVSFLRKKLEEKNIPCYEADIPFTQRFFIDNNIKASISIKGEFTQENNTKVFIEPEINPTKYFPKNLKILSIDIETNKTAKILYAISFYSEGFKKTLLHSSKENNIAETFNSEKKLLIRAKEIIKEFDPDIITGWNVISFDFERLKYFFKKNKIKFDLGRLDEECTLHIEKSFMKDSSADFKGRLLLDGLRLAKISLIKLDDYKLNTAAKTILQDTKLITSDNRGDEIEELFLNDQQRLAEYNLKDAKLVYDIIEKSGIMKLSIKRSILTGMLLDKIQASIATFDSVYLPRLREKKRVAFSLNFSNKHGAVRGGFVLPSKPGIYDWVIVCDYKSLYPTVFRTFNIDPYSYFYNKNKIPKDLEKLDKCEFVVAPNKAIFKNQEGILPEIIKKLMIEREKAKKNNNKLESLAIKTLMASFSGVLMSSNCRFSTFELGDSITSFAQMIIKKTMNLISEKGFDIIYGDTDSIFIDLHVNSFEDAEKKGKEITNYINNYFKEYIKKEYCRESYLELEFEKTYSRFLMPSGRDLKHGTKKRYAGMLIKKQNNKYIETLEFTGLEFVRRDWTEAAKTFQYELFKRVFKKEKIDEFIREFVKDILKGKYDKQLVYKKALRKEASEYIKTTPPHVKAARKLKGFTTGIIEYIITIEGPEPIQNLKHKIDYEHYIQKQIKPIANTVLIFFNKKFEDIITESKQKKLFSFK